MNKVLIGIALGGVCIVLLAFIIIAFVSMTSKKLVCKSNEGNITIMYNDKKIKGYTASGFTYDLDGQQKYAEQVGIDAYLDEFSSWFSSNTTGSCTR